jgi:hypothetical protein
MQKVDGFSFITLCFNIADELNNSRSLTYLSLPGRFYYCLAMGLWDNEWVWVKVERVFLGRRGGGRINIFHP